MAFVFRGIFTRGTETIDTDIRSLTVHYGSSGPILLASNGINGILTVYRVASDGALTSTASAWLTDLPLSAVAGDLEIVSIGETVLVVIGDAGDGGLIAYPLSDTGVLGDRMTITLPSSNTDLSDAVMITYGDGSSAMVVVDHENATLSSFLNGSSLSAGATLETGLTGHAGFLLGQAATDTGNFVLVADVGGNSLSSYRIDASTGAMDAAHVLGPNDGFGINTPTQLSTVSAYGETWVLLSAAQTDSISVLRLEGDGRLALVDHVADTLNTRFAQVQCLEIFEVDGLIFVLAGGADGGMSLFSLQSDGRLLLHETLVHTSGAGLQDISDIAAVVTDQTVEIYVSSDDSAGVARYGLALSDLPRVTEGSGALTGTDAPDILLAGADDTTLTGGAGADIFVLPGGAATYQITDFEVGVDRLDLSRFAMLRSTDQLTFQQTGTGAWFVYGDTTVYVESSDGSALTVEQIWPQGFDWSVSYVTGDGSREVPYPGAGIPETSPEAAPAPWSTPSRPGNAFTQSGTEGDDSIRGRTDEDNLIELGDGNDTVWDRGGDNYIDGGRGDDDMSANSGNDTILGGQGHDSMMAFGGDDFMDGGSGKDTVWGGKGDDYLSGGAGKDLIGGADGDDTHFGGDGNDTIFGGAGDDYAMGQGGDDRVWMSTDNDTVYGGDGNDSLGGGHNNDLVLGEAGNDLIYGGYDDDTLYGGSGDDTVWSGPGRDVAYGGDGADTVGGGEENDVVYGGAGDDEVWGGTGNDYLYGDAGNDTLEGEAGVDVFVFAAGHGDDVINRFDIGEDFLSFEIAALSSYSSLSISDSGLGVVIDTTEGTVTLAGLSLADLNQDDFVFM